MSTDKVTPDKTHFGFTEVPVHEKVERVGQVFSSVANQYDLMNDLMSFGIHRLWKQFTVSTSGVRQGHHVLDIAGGSGDLAIEWIKKVGKKGHVILADINDAMLKTGRTRLTNLGYLKPIDYIQANAEVLPFKKNTFDCISFAFGLRNVTDKRAALASCFDVLKPGGHCLVLEFSKPILPMLDTLYEMYSFNVIPKLGKWICQDESSYQYLVESIRMHPDQDNLKSLFEDAGFEDVTYHNLSGGIVALHKGYKY